MDAAAAAHHGHRPLAGRTVLVTGASRRAGIGHAIACRAAELGASIALHGHSPADAEQPWGADDADAVLASVRAHLAPGARLLPLAGDLSDPEVPAALVRAAWEQLGRIDGLVCNHAASGHDGTILEITAEDLDHHWRVNARASLLLVQALATLRAQLPADPDRPGCAVVLMTSGQGLGPMPGEIAYITSKAALAGLTPSLADGVADLGMRVNTVNPGPVDTGYMTEELRAALAPRFPGGRLPSTDDPARLICWLLTDDAAWVTGQVISTEGGFRRG